MGDIDFIPVLSEITSAVKDVKFSTMYYNKHCGKSILLVKHQSKTIMIALRDDHQWSVQFHTIISSRDRSIRTTYKIDGNQNTILLLDGDGQLWKLINAFEFSNEKDECLYLIDEKCFYEWVPFKKFEHFRVLEITALESGFACLLENQQSKKALKIFSSDNWTLLEDYFFEDLNALKSQSFYLMHVPNEYSGCLTKSVIEPANEVFIIADRISGRTYISSKSVKDFVVNISSVPLISALVFKEKKFILLCYQNGKFLFVLFNDAFSSIGDCTMYVFQNVTCVEKCDCCESCILWSDGINLHHTNILFELEKSCFIKLLHLKVVRNIFGIKSFRKINNGAIAVTINNFYYHITANSFIKPMKILMSPDEILSKIFEGSLKMNSLNKEIEIATDYLIFKEMIQTHCFEKQIKLRQEHDYIILQSSAKQIFKKNFWRIRQSASVGNKQFVEMSDFETDFCEGMTVKIKNDSPIENQVEVSLVGNFGNDFDLLIFFVGKLDMDRSNAKKELSKNLYEIARKRNPYFK